MNKFWTVFPMNFNYGVVPRERYDSLPAACAEAEWLQANQPAPEGYAVMEMVKLARSSLAPVELVNATAQAIADPAQPEVPPPPGG